MKQFRLFASFTRRDSASLERYFNDIGKIALLSIEEEVSLTTKIRNGDKDAMQILIRCNLRFVVSVAKRYQDSGLKLADLISEGNLGLIKAAENFDHTRGFRFISFAVWWIRQSILMAIASHRRLVRLPSNQLVDINRINRAAMALEQKLERLPTFEELSVHTAIPEHKIAYCLDRANLPYSLDRIVNETSGLTLIETLSDNNFPGTDHLTHTTSLSAELIRVLNVLPQRERKIIMLYYGIDGHAQTSLEEMEPIFNLGKERIRQLKDKARRTLTIKFINSPYNFCRKGS